MTAIDDRSRLRPDETHDRSSTDVVHSGGQRPTQLHLFSYGPTIWDRQHHALNVLELARELHPSLGLETTDGRTWRVISVTADMRRALERLDIAEDDVIPDPVLIEQRRRCLLARMQVAQARDVLRGVQLEYDAARERRELHALLDEEGAA